MVGRVCGPAERNQTGALCDASRGEAALRIKLLRARRQRAGATDWRAAFGEAGARVTRQRGRWDSTVAQIYQRPLLHEQLQGAAAAGGATGTDLEALCADFAQRAVR